MDAGRRAVRAVVQLNASGPSVWEVYAHHRERLMRLCCAVQRGQGLCVLGAGNGDDLDLPVLVKAFGEVHLVDVDEEALASGVARLPAAIRGQVTLHGRIDVTGLLGRIDELAVELPRDEALAAAGEAAAAAVTSAVGRTFDVVLSDCLLSQLPAPFKDALLMDGGEWKRLFRALNRTHFALMAALVRPGGTGVVACDVLSSAAAPELLEYAAPSSWELLGADMAARIGRGERALDPNPADLLALLKSPTLADAIERPRLTEPWTWNLGSRLQLVCAIVWSKVDPES